MALGGGTFLTQNKILPGSYINFVSASRASSALGSRGICAFPLELDWGVDGEVFEVTREDFQKNSTNIFGYEYTNIKLCNLRELFLNASTLYAFRLNSGDKAQNEIAVAKNSGIRGNEIVIVIKVNVDDDTKFDVETYLEKRMVDSQTVEEASQLTANDYVVFKSDAVIQAIAGTPLTGGTNGEVIGKDHQTFLDKIESYSFNALGVATEDSIINSLYVSFTKRMREEVGVKFQTVLYNTAADYEGVVNVKNEVDSENKGSLVYWACGVIGGASVNGSALNKLYDGEYSVISNYTQSQLETAIQNGEFTLHKVGNEIRILSDINSLVTVTSDRGDIFKENQTVRVIDQIANDVALMFNSNYIGKVPNDSSGRASFWGDVCKYHKDLQSIRAIEDFSDSDISVVQGDTKKSVAVTSKITVVNTMAQLYMTVVIS